MCCGKVAVLQILKLDLFGMTTFTIFWTQGHDEQPSWWYVLLIAEALSWKVPVIKSFSARCSTTRSYERPWKSADMHPDGDQRENKLSMMLHDAGEIASAFCFYLFAHQTVWPIIEQNSLHMTFVYNFTILLFILDPSKSVNANRTS